MKKLEIIALSLFTLVFCGIKSNAQIDDTKAKTILDGVSAKMKSYTTMKIDFTYSMVNAKTNVNESKSGTIQIKGSKYHLEVGGQVVFCDATTVWTYIKDEVQGGKTIAIIDMTPIKAKSYYKVRLNIDKIAQQITSTIVYDKNGSTYTYTVTKFTSNVPMADALFTFNKANYPGVQVNDMR